MERILLTTGTLPLEGLGVELPLFYGCSLCLLFALMHQVEGKLVKVRHVLRSHKFIGLLSPRWAWRFDKFLNFTSRIMMAMPFVTLGTWVAGLLSQELFHGLWPIGGVGAL